MTATIPTSIAGGAITVTVLKNTAPTTLTCSITAGSTSCSDSTDKVSFNANDGVAYQVVNATLVQQGQDRVVTITTTFK